MPKSPEDASKGGPESSMDADEEMARLLEERSKRRDHFLSEIGIRDKMPESLKRTPDPNTTVQNPEFPLK